MLEAAFAAVRTALVEAVDPAPLEDDSAFAAAGLLAEDAAVLGLARCELGGAVGGAAVAAVRAGYASKVQAVRQAHARYRASHDARRDALDVRERCLRATVDHALAAAACAAVECDARLRRQLGASERRLQELAHECVGEHEKARRRIVRRRDVAAATVSESLEAARLTSRWAIFCARLEHDDARKRLELEDVAPQSDDFQSAAQGALEALTRPGPVRSAALQMLRQDAPHLAEAQLRLQLDGLHVARCVRLHGCGSLNARPAVAAQVHLFFPHAFSPSALVDLLRGPAAAHVSASPPPRGKRDDASKKATPRKRRFSAATLVPVAPVAWLVSCNPKAALEGLECVDATEWFDAVRSAEVRPDPCTAAAATCFVYYRVKERSSAQKGRVTATGDESPASDREAEALDLFCESDLAEAQLRATNVAYSCGFDGAPAHDDDDRRSASCMRCSGSLTLHLASKDDDAASAVDKDDGPQAFPAVLRAADGEYFAAASMLQLVETRRFARALMSRDATRQRAALDAKWKSTAPLWGALDSLWVATAHAPLCNDALDEGRDWALRRLSDAAVVELLHTFVPTCRGHFQGEAPARDACDAPGQLSTQTPASSPSSSLSAKDAYPTEHEAASADAAPNRRYFSLLAPKHLGDLNAPSKGALNEALLVAWDVPGPADGTDAPPLLRSAGQRAYGAATPLRLGLPWARRRGSESRVEPSPDEAASPASPLKPDGDGRFDDDILADFCQWRACAKRTATTSAKRSARRLCAWHCELKAFLDARADKASEAHRFVPKPREFHCANPDDEAAAIKRASPLLVELANGKLGATVRVFCRRAAAEASELHGGNASPGASPGAPQDASSWPQWAKWCDGAAVERHKAQLARGVEFAEQVIAAERSATRELRALRDAGVFPQRALHAIRREHLRLERERDGAASAPQPAFASEAGAADASAASDEQLELEFARRKLALLRDCRRQALGAAPHLDGADAVSDRPRTAGREPSNVEPGSPGASDKLPAPAPQAQRAGAAPRKAPPDRKSRFVSPYLTRTFPSTRDL
mmetsp:Transcript_13153/g.45530  ORF Transcript_13153/g.45530 Transcript_13153/m.45530 type:complete len:1047 (-) Transcript_13153:53-3193(-)